MLYKLRIRVLMQNRYLVTVLGVQLLHTDTETRHISHRTILT